MVPAASPPKISRATSPGMTRMITNTRAAAPKSVGMIRSSRFRMYVRMVRSPRSQFNVGGSDRRIDCPKGATPPSSSPGPTPPTGHRGRQFLHRLSVLRQPDVLELLVGVVIGRRHVVLHLGPVHHGPPPPEARDVVRVFEDDLLDLVDEPLALGRVQDPRLARVEVVDPGVGESTPV